VAEAMQLPVEPPTEDEPELKVQPVQATPEEQQDQQMEIAETEPGEAPVEATASPEPAQTAALGSDVSAAGTEEEESQAPGDTAAEAVAAENYRIWLSSADSEAAANEMWREARGRHQTALASVDMTIHPVDHGDDGTFYRVLAGPLDSRDAAADLCQRLRAEAPNTFCMVINP
jgi:cell division septation protein DedD